MAAIRENWLPVVGYEHFYEVSDLGRVAAVSHSVRTSTGKGWRHVNGGLLKPSNNGLGYLQVGLTRDGRRRQLLVHRLVMAAFVGPLPEGMEVRHGPGGSVDNRLANLSYGTKSENEKDKARDGTVPERRGEFNARSKLTWPIVEDCRRRSALGEPHRALAREHGVGASVMWRAIRGITWSSNPETDK